ncbi:aldo/keto reductase [Candidatus Thorarchaeota archaeon]|nr:MAG: aldo/keto reductase [Candidatus Thorarchaeota archaeon]
MTSAKIPRIGLGTWENTDPKQCPKTVANALEMGYRMIDTAQMYNNEELVGKGIRMAEVPREEITLATKIWFSDLSSDDIQESTRGSLDRLDVDYVDLLYVHWPAESYDATDTLPALAGLADEGLVREVAVSNFTPELMDEALRECPKPVVADQVEMHPLLRQEELHKYLVEHDIHLVAYSPLARGRVMDVPELTEIAGKHDISEAQVSLAWLLSKEMVTPIPKATSEDHLRQNIEALDITLDAEDIEKIDSLSRLRRMIDPSFAPDW